MPHFLKLEDLVTPPPLPAIIAVLMTLGFKYLGGRLVKSLKEKSSPSQGCLEAAGFMAVAGLLAAAVHLLALLGWAYLWPLRLLAWSLAAGGVLELARWGRGQWLEPGRGLKAVFQGQSAWGKAAILALGVAAAGLWLAALGPPTDADSLDYHLGVPLSILRHHGAEAAPAWFHARLVGLGEYLNLLGLAGGTDILGASLQFAGLVAVLAALYSFARTDADRILMYLCVLGCPVLGFLIPNQKPQMLATAATTVALVLIAQRFSTMTAGAMVLALTAAFFAMACKYSFLLTGGLVVGAGLMAAYRSRLLAVALGAAVAGYLIFLFPLHLQNLLFYGDPISPFLERFRAHGDAAVVRFAAYLRAYSDAHGNLLPLPLRLLLPSSPGYLTTVLGVGPLLWLLAARGFKEQAALRVLLTSAFLGLVAIVIWGQIGARYLLEPYLWSVPAVAAAPWRPLKTFFFKAMVGQAVLMALLAGYGAATLFPGALSPSLRDRVMAVAANGYVEARWLDRVTPPGAVLLAANRSSALLPRPSVSADRVNFSHLEVQEERRRVLALLRSAGVNTLVADFPQPRGNLGYFAPCLAGRIAGPMEFPQAFRNPWNRGPTRQIAAYRLELERWQGSSRWENQEKTGNLKS